MVPTSLPPDAEPRDLSARDDPDLDDPRRYALVRDEPVRDAPGRGDPVSAGSDSFRAPARTGTSDAASVAHLVPLGRLDLLRLWRETMGRCAPKSISRPLLRRILAWELQARVPGALPADLRRRLEALGTSRASVEGTRAGPVPARPRAATLRPGGRLLREWAGITHVVDVTPDGYLWNGTRHASLSAIARAITGARWSGPRFFGLQAAAAVATAAAAAAGAAGAAGTAAGVRAKQSTRPTTRPRASTPLATARATPIAMSRAARSPAGRSP